jgi:outer membrane lipoprotein carrier protein
MSLLFAFLLVLVPSQDASKLNDFNSLLDGVQRSFAQMNDLSADFVQKDQNPLNRNRQASGHLYLMRPRKMRWEYQMPEEQLFVSDGKTVYFYVPGDRQVNKESVKDTFDDRMPLMFLLGRSDLRNEFTRFELNPVDQKPFLQGTQVVRMYPKRKTDIKDVVMEADPANYQIRRLILNHNDGSRSEFIFSNIRLNTGLKTPLFDFKVPAGVQVVQGIGQ